ncbi:MAG TPA: pitrilysin family protein [Pyrinomonadaceae bacterium]|nr:pitrilysin family protein [Pyrinomonadaceae bacterium]
MSSAPRVTTQPPPLPPRPIRIPRGEETFLPNGLKVILVEDRRLPLVSYRLALRCGDAHDPRELPGLTDTLTGLLTEGTESRTSRQIADEVARMGASLSAGANSDYTNVAASSLARFTDQVLDILADVTLRPSFPENEVELAKQNTIESLKQQRAQPSFLATEMVSRVMYGEHPYSVVSPTPESIKATTRGSLVDFHRNRFVPNNAVLTIGGDLKSAQVIAKVESLFSEWEAGSAPSEEFPPLPDRVRRTGHIVDRPGSAQSNIVIANAGITRTSPDYFPMLLMHTVLGANASSRLFMNLREEKGYTYGAYSSLDARRTAGTVRATAEVRTPVTGDSLKEFIYELNRIRTEPVSEKEISDAKSYLTGVFPIRLETQEGLIDQLVQIEMFGLPRDYLETYRDCVQAVTIEQIQEVAERYIRPDQAAIVIVGDGKQILEQVSPFTSDLEFYNTAGKRKERPSASAATAVLPNDVAGNWTLSIETPLGQGIPANLTLASDATGISGRVESEMGTAVINSAEFNGTEFSAVLAFDMDGTVLEAQIEGEISGEQISGTITLESTPPLPFTGRKQ